MTDDHVRAWHLTQVRAEQDRTQEEVAQVMGVKQPRVAAIERGELDRHALDAPCVCPTLGGKVHVVADFADRSTG